MSVIVIGVGRVLSYFLDLLITILIVAILLFLFRLIPTHALAYEQAHEANGADAGPKVFFNTLNTHLNELLRIRFRELIKRQI